jgi:hypothetical protein
LASRASPSYADDSSDGQLGSYYPLQEKVQLSSELTFHYWHPHANPGQRLTSRKLKQGWAVIESVSETSDPDIKVVTKVKLQGDPGYLWTCCE